MIFKFSKARILAVITLIIVLSYSISCERKEGPEGKPSLIDLISEAPSINCPSGGYKIITGVDLNSNGILEEQEIQNTKYICHGDGRNSLMSVLTESQGENCPAGGYKIIAGLDLNSNSVLDSVEVQHTEFICHGDVGHNSITSVSPEEAGEICPLGGVKIITGIDINENSILDSSEVHQTEFICNGQDGEMDKQIRFDFGSGGWGYGTNTTNWTIVFPRIPYFNLNNYPNVDSIMFTAELKSESLFEECKVQLFDITNNQVIENTEFTMNSANYVLVETTVNLFDFIPKEEITLGIRVKSSKSNHWVFFQRPQLVLYRK